jgi:hypothetical protein
MRAPALPASNCRLQFIAGVCDNANQISAGRPAVGLIWAAANQGEPPLCGAMQIN